MPFGWFKKWKNDNIQEKRDKKNERGKEIYIDEITTHLISFLEVYPKHNSQILRILLDNPKTKKIVTCLLEGNVLNLSVEDFEQVERSGEFLYNCGTCFLMCGLNYDKKELLNLSVSFFRKSTERLKKGTYEYASALMNEGVTRRKLSELGVNSVDNLEKAIGLFERAKKEGFVKNTPYSARNLMNEGNAWLNLAELGVNPVYNLEKAMGLFERAREEGFARDTPDYALSLMNEGVIRRKLAHLGVNPVDNLEKAVVLYERARKKGIAGNSPGYALSLMNEGNAKTSLAHLGVNPVDNLEKAIGLFERAREEGFAKSTPDYALSLMHEGIARSMLAEHGINPSENFKKAIQLYERAREEGLVKDTPSYTGVLMNEGATRQKLAELGVNTVNNFEKAIGLFERAREEGFAKNTPDYARNLMNEGGARSGLAELGINPVDNFEKAIKLYERAREEGFAKNTPDYAATLANEGIARRMLAEHGVYPTETIRKAIELFERAREEGLAKNSPDYGSSLMNEGNAWSNLAELGINPTINFRKAIKLFERARKEGYVKNTPAYASALVNEGIAMRNLGELEVAIKLFEKAREEGFTKNTPDYGSSLMNEGNAWSNLAELGVNPEINLRKAIKLFERAREEGFIMNTPSYARALMNEGGSWGRLIEVGKESVSILSKVESMYLKARYIFWQTNNKIGLIKVNQSVGYLNYSNNEMSKAYDYFKEAIHLIEEMRTSIKIPELRKEYFETVANTYKNMVLTCLALGKNEEAFKYAESAKGRTFLEILASEKKIIKGNREIVENYKDILRKINHIEIKLISGKEIGDKEEELLVLKRLHDDLLKEIKQSDPEYYTIKTVEPINLNELSKILSERTLIEYFLGKKLVIFVVNAGLTVKDVEIDEKEISKKILEFRKLVSEFETIKAEEILKEFYKLLIEPIKQHLSKDKEIIIVPHSYLHLIPFQALKGERYLIEDHKISFAQSASSLRFLKNSIGKGSLVVGNPTEDLDHAEVEAIEVAKRLKTYPVLRNEAKKDRIMKEIKNKEILHFACHGLFDSSNPSFSGIILADGSITAIDFMDLEIDSNLIVLSACETALGKFAVGDEVEGLIRAIQYGGCRFVIASLWPVADESTKELFLKFYETSGSIVDRIREAELSLMNEYDFFYWAPFQVYGI